MKEEEKSTLENEKLRLEIKELKRPRFLRSEYLNIIVLSLIAVVSVIVSWHTGFFSLERKINELDKKSLVWETVQLQQKKDSIQAGISRLEDSIIYMMFEYRDLELRFVEEKTDKEETERQLSELRRKMKSYENDLNYKRAYENAKRQIDILESKIKSSEAADIPFDQIENLKKGGCFKVSGKINQIENLKPCPPYYAENIPDNMGYKVGLVDDDAILVRCRFEGKVKQFPSIYKRGDTILYMRNPLGGGAIIIPYNCN